MIKRNLNLIAAAFLLVFSCQIAFADNVNNSSKNAYPELDKARYVFLIDQDTQEVLFQKNADAKITPSSMTKLMTAYVIFDQLEKGTIKLDNECVIGKDAWKKSGSKMFLNYGDVVSIDKLITGLLVVSGNDASIALAEATSGSVENFAKLMNETGKKIGLKNSNFQNPHGLNQAGHYMSLRDLSIVATRLAKDFPQYLHYFSETDFTYQNITQRNRNPLIKKGYEGATGMKTGHTDAGGFGMVGTATRGNRRLIAVTNEAKTPIQRERIITELLDYGFNDYKKITFFDKNYSVAKARTWLGEKSEVELVSKQEISMTIPSEQSLDNVKVKIKYRGPLYAPITTDKKIANMTIEINGKKVREVPLFAKENIDKAGYFSRIYQVAKYQFRQLTKVIKA
jgi:D-alanyl-D-alanine carboxypeptidase (penicillin-binding protein 5/6)